MEEKKELKRVLQDFRLDSGDIDLQGADYISYRLDGGLSVKLWKTNCITIERFMRKGEGFERTEFFRPRDILILQRFLPRLINEIESFSIETRMKKDSK